MQPITITSDQPKPALLENADTAEIVMPDFGRYPAGAYTIDKQADCAFQSGLSVAFASLLGREVDAGEPSATATVESDHAELALGLHGDQHQPVLIFDRFGEPSQMIIPVDGARLAHCDCVRIVPPIENIQRIVDSRSSKFHYRRIITKAAPAVNHR